MVAFLSVFLWRVNWLSLSMMLGLFWKVKGVVSRVKENEMMQLTCNGKVSIIDANYGMFGNSSYCVPSPVGDAVRRKCQDTSLCYIKASKTNFGDPCQGMKKELEVLWICKRIVHGGWTNWGPWGTCTALCSNGLEERSRGCNNPTPANGGIYCSGPRISQRPCFVKYCPTISELGNQCLFGNRQAW